MFAENTNIRCAEKLNTQRLVFPDIIYSTSIPYLKVLT